MAAAFENVPFVKSKAPTIRPPAGFVTLFFEAKSGRFRYIDSAGTITDVSPSSSGAGAVSHVLGNTTLTGSSLVVSRYVEIPNGITFTIGDDSTLEIS